MKRTYKFDSIKSDQERKELEELKNRDIKKIENINIIHPNTNEA